MRKSTFYGFLLIAFISLTVFQSCKDDRYLLTPPPVPDQSFVEEFDTADAAYNRGWRYINRSVLLGRRNWQNPNPLIGNPFPPYSGSAGNGFLWADYLSTDSQAGTISNWAVSPEIIMQNGDKIIFYTRAEILGNTDFVNRLQVRINKTTSLNVGNGTDPGDFTIPLLDINPFYYEFLLNVFNNPADPLFEQVRKAYPHVWTRFEAVVVGLDKPTKGRFAFRYFTELAGSNGRGSSVGLDSVAYVSINH